MFFFAYQFWNLSTTPTFRTSRNTCPPHPTFRTSRNTCPPHPTFRISHKTCPPIVWSTSKSCFPLLYGPLLKIVFPLSVPLLLRWGTSYYINIKKSIVNRKKTVLCRAYICMYHWVYFFYWYSIKCLCSRGWDAISKIMISDARDQCVHKPICHLFIFTSLSFLSRTNLSTSQKLKFGRTNILNTFFCIYCN